ncbi:hypothetical protein Gasu2_41250 [Galdieria sulphuraria]|nr:hypothetical protein Gasu2_41250 [Galdieria sulphuraria]
MEPKTREGVDSQVVTQYSLKEEKEPLKDWIQQSIQGLGVGLSSTFVLVYRGVDFLHNKATTLVDQHKDISTSEVAKNSLQGFYSGALAAGMVAYLGALNLFQRFQEWNIKNPSSTQKETKLEPK